MPRNHTAWEPVTRQRTCERRCYSIGVDSNQLANSVNPENRLLTVQQFAELEGFTQNQVRYLIKAHGLPTYRVNGIRIRHGDYLAWLETRRSA